MFTIGKGSKQIGSNVTVSTDIRIKIWGPQLLSEKICTAKHAYYMARLFGGNFPQFIDISHEYHIHVQQEYLLRRGEIQLRISPETATTSH